MDVVAKGKNLCPCQELNRDCTAHSLVTTITELSWIKKYYIYLHVHSTNSHYRY